MASIIVKVHHDGKPSLGDDENPDKEVMHSHFAAHQ